VGYWFSPLKEALDAFFDNIQKYVNGTARIRLYKGNAVVVGIKADKALYQEDMATYSDKDAFDHEAAKGFITIWGLPAVTWKSVHKEKSEKPSFLKVVGNGAN